jgi:signal transduction histidine kinase
MNIERDEEASVLENFSESLLHSANNTLQELRAALEFWVMDLEDEGIDRGKLRAGTMVLPALMRLQYYLLNDVRDALAYAEGTLHMAEHTVDLLPCLYDAIRILEYSERAAGVSLTVQAPSEPLVVVTDPSRLQRLLITMLTLVIRAQRGAHAPDLEAPAVALEIVVVAEAASVAIMLPLPPHSTRTLAAWCPPFYQAMLERLQIRPVFGDATLALHLPHVHADGS